MIDMPAAIQNNMQTIDWGRVQEAVADYGPVIDVVRSTWTKESLRDIMAGHIAVPEETINAALAAKTDQDAGGGSIRIHARDDGRLDVTAQTDNFGRVEFSGTIEAFVHNADESYMTYRVKEKELPEQGLLSWFFSRVSLSMAEKIVGHADLSEDLPTSISGNDVRVDFHDRLEASALGQTSVRGYKLLDVVEIKDAQPHEGYIEFSTGLKLPDNVKSILQNILS